MTSWALVFVLQYVGYGSKGTSQSVTTGFSSEYFCQQARIKLNEKFGDSPSYIATSICIEVK